MSDNILQTLQHLVQDVIAPDVRELKANQSALEKQLSSLERHMDVRFQATDEKIDARFQSIEDRFDARFQSIEDRFDARFQSIEQRLKAADEKADARFEALMSAISESRAQAELAGIRAITSLSERVAVLEALRH